MLQIFKHFSDLQLYASVNSGGSRKTFKSLLASEHWASEFEHKYSRINNNLFDGRFGPVYIRIQVFTVLYTVGKGL